MGCKQSTAVRVQPVGPTEMKTDLKLKKKHSETDPIETDIDGGRPRSHGRRKKSGKHRKRNMGSQDSLSDDGLGPESDRGGSAGSKKSQDSGLGEGDLGEDNGGFITEYSDPDKVRTVEDGFSERADLDLAVTYVTLPTRNSAKDKTRLEESMVLQKLHEKMHFRILNLAVTGVTLPTRNSAKDKARLEESMILQKLREEGLISKTTAEKSNSVSFEVVDASAAAGGNQGKLPALPPIKLAKLERRRKKKRTLTEDEIREKLERAEQRRKRKEQSRLDKIKDLDKADQTAALGAFQDYVKKKEVQAVQKMESVSDKRERRLADIKEKQLERERKREEVRRRKKELMLQGVEGGEGSEATGEIMRDASELMATQGETQ